MAEESAPTASPILSRATLQSIRRARQKYPWARSAVLPALWAVQEQLGYLPPAALGEVAQELGVVPSEVEAVATFYSMYFQHPPGRHLIQVCLNVSCGLRGADQLLQHLEGSLGVEDGGTTEDREFTLQGTVECLGACGGAPMMQVDRYSYEDLDPEAADRVLAQVRSRPGAGGRREHA
ncbi:MAG: NADH-quinone oxidoreductase subunit NuoE [Candidatus Dormibacteria bacterium]